MKRCKQCGWWHPVGGCTPENDVNTGCVCIDCRVHWEIVNKKRAATKETTNAE